MILVILAVAVALVILGVVIYTRTSFDLFPLTLIAIGVVGFVVSIIAIGFLSNEVMYANTLDDQIEMYQAENAEIEQTILNVVKDYQDYETDKIDDLVGAVLLYPELGSSELVQTQMELYVENNKMIKELKAAQITASVNRWWLYFGG